MCIRDSTDEERLAKIKGFVSEMGVQTVLCRHQNSDKSDEFWNSLLTSTNNELPRTTIDQDSDFAVMYTSGSTGHPKGVCSSHKSIISTLLQWMVVAKARNIKDEIIANEEIQPSCLLTVPLFHVTGSHAQFMLSFLSGRKMVIMYKWDSEKALSLIEKEKITTLNGVPTMTLEVMRDENR